MSTRASSRDASDRRLRRSIRVNLQGDLITQAAVLVIILFIYRSEWMWALWAVRWLVVGSVVLAGSLADRGRRRACLAAIAAGHAVGGIGSAAILPEFAPLVMIVLFGDLLMGSYLDRRSLRTYLTCGLGVVATVALISLNDWTGLASDAPGWLVVAVVVVHGAGTGVFTAQFGRENYQALAEQQRDLEVVRERLGDATRDERGRIEAALTSGVMADLARLGDDLDEIASSLRAAPTRAAALADDASRRATATSTALRELSHGIFPDALRQFGLGTAVRSALSAFDATVEVPDTRYPAAVEGAVFAVVSDLVSALRSAADELGSSIRVSAVAHGGVLYASATWSTAIGDAASSSPPNDTSSAEAPVLAAATADRLAALGGSWTIERSRGGHGGFVRLEVPLVESPAEPAERDADETRAEERILRRFLLASSWLCGVGLPFAGAVWAFTGVESVGVVFVTLIFVMLSIIGAERARRRGRLDVTIALLCIETCLAAIAVTVAVPDFVTVTALITTLPLVLALPYLSVRALDVIGAVQVTVLVVVTLIALRDSSVVDPAPLPWVLTLLVVPIATVAVAVLVVVAVVATRDEVSDGTAVLRGTLFELVEATDAERRRIERDLHDGAQQHVVAAAMQLRVIARLAGTDPDRALDVVTALRSQTDEARDDLVSLVAGSFPSTLVDVGLVDAVRRAAARGAVPVRLRVMGTPTVPPHVAAAVYYCVHEALQNVNKHAVVGTSAEVVLRFDEQLSFEVADDGAGFDPTTVAMGRGVRSMTERLAEIGGAVRVSSTPGVGTRVAGVAPLR
jgi:signal transduction histidine kinase